MNLLTISFNYLTHRLHNSILNIIMMASGIMIISVLMLFGYQISQRLNADSKGIDAVIGAKGSPLQLILSSIWHVDIPTGNINFDELKKIKQHPMIKKAIPITLGDSYQGSRIVGTEASYIQHFKGSFASGEIWKNSMEAVVGSSALKKSNLKIGDYFLGSHGLMEGGEIHKDSTYKVVGILNPTKTVLDRLIITSISSAWNVHHEDHHQEHNAQEITALLISYNSKIAAMTFPRFINKNTNLQASSPSFEIARLIKLIGIGKDGIMLFGVFLILLSLSSMLIGLLNSVHQRRYDLAIFRSLGAPRKKIFLIVVIEGMTISILGSLIGLILGHLATQMIGIFSIKGSELGLTGFIFIPQIFILWLIILAFCFIICLVPAIRAYKTDIKEMLTHA